MPVAYRKPNLWLMCEFSANLVGVISFPRKKRGLPPFSAFSESPLAGFSTQTLAL